MKHMTDKTKRTLFVGGALVLCAVLVVMIGGRLQKEQPKDLPLPTESTQSSEVTVNPEVNAPVVSGSESNPQTQPPADAAGTEQTIQGDVSKPTYTDEQLKNPDQKPNGDKVTAQDKPVEHDKVTPPPAETPKPSQPQGGDTKDGKIYVPGFGWIDDVGEGQGTTVDGDGDINKQVGQMGE